jgi:hypothetical protein
MVAATRVAVMAALRKSGKGVFSHKKLDILPAYPLLSTHFALCPVLFLCGVCLLAATRRPSCYQPTTTKLCSLCCAEAQPLFSFFSVSISLINKYYVSSFYLYLFLYLLFISSFPDLFFFLYLILYFLCLKFLSMFLIVY